MHPSGVHCIDLYHPFPFAVRRFCVGASDTNPPAPQGAVPRPHQAHQDQLGVSLAELALEAVHWNPKPTASGSIGLVCFFSLSGPRARARAIDVDIGHIPCAAIGRLRAARPVSGRQPPPPPGQAGV